MPQSNPSPTPAEIEGAVARVSVALEQGVTTAYDCGPGDYYPAAVARYVADIRTLLAALAQGREDSARLAFIARACLSVDYCWTSASEPGWWQVYQGGQPVPPNGDTYATIRDAIDAARATGEGANG